MGKIEWNRHFQTGIQEVDSRNEQFIHNMNEMLDTIRHEKNAFRLKRLLNKLADHIRQHFLAEEVRLREKLNEVEYSDHKNRHLFIEDFLRTPFLLKPDCYHYTVEEVSDFLEEWFTVHIQYLDKDAFLSENPSSNNKPLTP